MSNHVKIYGVKPRIQYTADGTSTSFEFQFAIFKPEDIDVYFADVLQNSSSYTVTQNENGGSVTFETAPEAGTIVTIIRNLSIERTTDFQEGSILRANVLNDELDYQIACQQQIAENLNRSMVLPPYATANDLDLTLPTPSAGKAIVWNASGTNLENSEVEINTISRQLDAKVTAATTQAGIASSAAQTATMQAGVATTQAGIAASKADIASQKADAAAATATALASQKTVVETYVNGTEWYRVWSDGWIEQGGRITSAADWNGAAVLLKPFSNTNYNILATTSRNGFGQSNDAYNYHTTAEASSTSNFLWAVIGGSAGFRAFQWYACGY